MNKRTTCGTLRAKLTQPRSPSVRARSLLTSRQRREKNPVLKDGYGAVKKLMEIHQDPEADAYRRSRAAQFLAWQTERLAKLSSSVHGEDGR